MALTSHPLRSVVVKTKKGNGHTVDWIRETKSFTVTPSPCTNGTNFKMPGEYSYSGDHYLYPFGMSSAGYFAGQPGRREFYDSGYYGCLSGLALSGFGWDDPIDWHVERINAQNRALVKIYDKIKSSDVNISTTIGEGRETLTMMAAISRGARKPLQGLKDLIVKSRSKKRMTREEYREFRGSPSLQAAQQSRDAAASTLATVSSGWLIWAVGLKPLLNDLGNLVTHIKSLDNLDIKYSVNARGTARLHRNESRTILGGESRWSIDDSEYHQYGITYRISDMHAFENWRLGLTVRPTLAWELTTLSFVVDYFIGIGNFLASYESAILNNGIVFDSGYHTVCRRKVGSFTWSRSASPLVDPYPNSSTTSPEIYLGGFAEGLRSHIHKERSRINSFPVQAMPTLKLPRVAEQLFTVASLISLFVLSRR